MAEYLVLIYGDEEQYATGSQEFLTEIHNGHAAFGEKHGASIRGGNALQPTSTATTLRFEGDKANVTDGPFAETKEALGGYYLIEAADLDEAIAIASDIPAPKGGLEVRPIQVFS